MYAMATLAVSVNIFLLLKLVKGERLNLFFFILSNIGVLASDYLAYFIFPAQLVFLLLIRKRELLKKWFIALILALAFGIWWMPTFLGQLDVGGVASANLPTWKLVVGGFDIKAIPLTFVKFIIGRISLADKLIYAAALLPICGLFAFLLWKGIKSLDSFPRRLLIIWIVIPPLIATIISLLIPVFSYFRVLFVIPGFIILLSAGILSFKNRLKYIFLSIVILIELFCTLVYLRSSLYQREDWKGLVNFFRDKPAVVLFESSGILPPFDYYARGELNAKGALKNFPAKNENDVANLAENEKNIYLIDYLVEISDPNRLVAKKLSGLGYKQTDIKNFTGVGFVYHYVKQ